MIRVRESGGVSSIAAIRVRESASVSTIAKISVREAGGLSTVYEAGGGGGSFTVSAIPLSPFGAAAINVNTTVTTETVSVTATGGVAPYTFAFFAVETEGVWTISVVADGVARFSRANVAPDDTWLGTFRCTVTDAAGREVDTPDITATVANYGRF